ncbi:MAG: endonuclease/exonuclease/phosphatase family protein [Candidatus Micrarchaeota archaeon]
MRKSDRGLYLLILAMAFLVIFLATRNTGAPGSPIEGNATSQPLADQAINQTAVNQSATNQTTNTTIDPATNQTNNSSSQPNISPLKVASFNIQVFGESKRSKPEVMDVLARIARNFDVMAVQELRDDTETTLPIYLEKINSLPGPRYASVSSPRLGRTSSKENYAFVYDTDTIRLVPGSNYTFADPPQGSAIDIFQREPFISRFQTSDGSYDFVLIVIHTEPDGTPAELGNLTLALDDASSRFPDETDFIMLGDMNADCSYLSKSEAQGLALRNQSFIWIVPDEADTTTKSTDCAYDRIILAGDASEEYLGGWGVYRFDQGFSLNQSQTEDVSDHYPVWASFEN